MEGKMVWEYCEMLYGLGGGYIYFHTPSGSTKSKHFGVQDRGKLLAELGRDGWELVGVGEHPGGHALFFKRPLS